MDNMGKAEKRLSPYALKSTVPRVVPAIPDVMWSHACRCNLSPICASVASACGSHKDISMVRYMWIAVDSAARLLQPLHPAVQGAETKVAVGLEGAHPQLLGQSEGLMEAFFGLLDIRGNALCGDLALEVEGSCLLRAFRVLLRILERLSCVREGTIEASGSQMDFPQPAVSSRLEVHEAGAVDFLKCFLGQWEGLSKTPRERVCQTEI
jgi:hypothetical protein